ncbi:MAG: hypothetical protein ACREV7_13015 [Steroidobacteraceae bacterium]
MSSSDESLKFPQPSSLRAALAGAVASPRLAVYVACAAAAVLANYLLGKEMMWDTLGYHLYAGFSALHDRFGRDYFAAGPQSYFNPYIYVPFYLLARSGLPALVATSILALLQSAILWLTYEIAVAMAPSAASAQRTAIGLCAVALAFANPILIAELGSSYCDITTAELVLAGWLLLARAVRSPSAAGIVCGGLLLGAVSALKLTNAASALSAFALLPFLPTTWRARIRFAAVFAFALGVGFLIVAAPWAIQLERHFGNPLFPLLNDVFRSPQYTTGSILDYRFIPDSLAEALWRPFAIVAPRAMVDFEYPSPDLRYAVLLILAVLVLLRLAWRRTRDSFAADGALTHPVPTRLLAALGCGFLTDWILWLRMSGSGRYFIAMACIAAVLVVVLVFRLFAARPKLRNYLIGAILSLQAAQLAMGAAYRVHVPWDGGPWFEISVPKPLMKAPSLYFLYGNLSNSFIAPFLPAGSGFINIGGSYALHAQGANGLRIRSLIGKYAPHLRVVMLDTRRDAAVAVGLPDFTWVNDELERFGLRADLSGCARIVLKDTVPMETLLTAKSPRSGDLPPRQSENLVACQVVPDPTAEAALHSEERPADLIFDRLEDDCAALFLPPHPVTRNYSGGNVHVWVRQYPGTGLELYVGSGRRVLVRDFVRGGSPVDLGSEREWLTAPPHLECGWHGRRYYLSARPARSAGPGLP